MWKFFGVDPELAREATDWSFRWLDPWPLWVVLIAAAGSLVLVYTLYRHEASELKLRDRLAFVLLRLAALAILVSMALEPAIVWDIPAERDATVLVLLDDSQSMGITDLYEGSDRLTGIVRALWPDTMGSWSGRSVSELPREHREELKKMTRADLVNRLLARKDTNFLAPLASGFRVSAFNFSESLKPVGGAERSPAAVGGPTQGDLLKVRLASTGPVTRAGDLLRQAVATSRQRVAGVLLVSDGASNVGEDLDSAARYLRGRGAPVPVYVLGVGDSRPLRDIAVKNFNANRVALINDLVTVDFELESQGFRGEKARVRLFRGEEPVEVTQAGHPVSVAEFVLEEKRGVKDGVEIPMPQRCRLTFKADKAGDFTYRLVVEERPEELITQNNSVSIPVRVIAEKIKVLYIEGEPRWEYRYLKTALVRDETVQVSCYLTAADFDFPQEGTLPIAVLPTKEEDLAKYDVIILGDVPASTFSPEQLALFGKFVETLGGGLICEAGEQGHMPGEYRDTVLGKMLPVDLASPSGAESRAEVQEWIPVLTPDGETHPMTRFEGDVDANRYLWKRLPGLYWYYPVARAKPGAQVLLAHPFGKSSYGAHPLLATQFYGNGKTAFLAFDATWRWRKQIGDRYVAKFWGQVIRDLSQQKLIGTSKRFHVATDRTEYRAGEKVTVTARALDRNFEPSRASELSCVVQGSGPETTRLKLEPVAGDAGSFRGTLTLSKPDAYRARLDVNDPDVTPESITHAFLVTRSMLEFVDPHLRRAELQRLADITGGKYYDVEHAKDIPKALQALRAETVRPVTSALWDAPAFFTFFCMFFLTELIYRKRRKLL